MTIEIYTPQNEVPEHILFYLNGKLMDFYHRDRQIDKAEVVLRRQGLSEEKGYVCEITLNLYGELLMIHRSGEGYLQVMREMLKELSLRVDEFSQRKSDLPEEILSTVKI